jgi:arylsulfatase B
VQLGDPDTWDGGYNATWGYEGLPTSMTTMAAQLKTAGYSTYHIGKSDGFGSLSEAHVSTGRGFDDALTYAHHGTDNYQYTIGMNSIAAPPPCLGEAWPNGSNFQDLWDGNQGANPAKYPTGTYKEQYFVERALSKIKAHDSSTPMFMYYATGLPHTPLQVPNDNLVKVANDMCAYNANCLTASGVCSLLPTCLNCTSVGECALGERITLLAMINYLDGVVSQLKSALVSNNNMWSNTVLLFSSDNGGGEGQGVGGSNYPLKGSKGSDWQGGFALPAFVASGSTKWVPNAGTVNHNLIHLSDWYTTMVTLAGGDATDAAGTAATGYPVNGVDVWRWVTGTASGEPHAVLPLSPYTMMQYDSANSRWLKLLTGSIGNTLWVGPDYPNTTCPAANSTNQCRPGSSAPTQPQTLQYDCGSTGCLYDLTNDPLETTNLNQSSSMKSVYSSMQTAMAQYQATYHEPWRGCAQQAAYCNSAYATWGGYYGIMVSNYPNTTLTSAGCPTCAQWYTPAPLVAVNTNECNCYYSKNSCSSNGGSMCAWTADSNAPNGGYCVLASKWANTTYTKRVLAKPRCTPNAFSLVNTTCID